jgi:putative endonuclease
MFYIYILKLNNGQLYTGYTSDLKNRKKQHDSGSVSSTRDRRPVSLIHYEAYILESDARRREKYLKNTEGKYFLKQQLKDLFEKIK